MSEYHYCWSERSDDENRSAASDRGSCDAESRVYNPWSVPDEYRIAYATAYEHTSRALGFPV